MELLAHLQVSLHHKHRKPAELKDPCSRLRPSGDSRRRLKQRDQKNGKGSELFLLRHHVQMSAFSMAANRSSLQHSRKSSGNIHDVARSLWFRRLSRPPPTLVPEKEPFNLRKVP